MLLEKSTFLWLWHTDSVPSQLSPPKCSAGQCCINTSLISICSQSPQQLWHIFTILKFTASPLLFLLRQPRCQPKPPQCPAQPTKSPNLISIFPSFPIILKVLFLQSRDSSITCLLKSTSSRACSIHFPFVYCVSNNCLDEGFCKHRNKYSHSSGCAHPQKSSWLPPLRYQQRLSTAKLQGTCRPRCPVTSLQEADAPSAVTSSLGFCAPFISCFIFNSGHSLVRPVLCLKCYEFLMLSCWPPAYSQNSSWAELTHSHTTN